MFNHLFANRTDDIAIVSGFEIAQKCKKLEATGKHVVHLEIGEPDFDTPANISEAGIVAIRQGKTHYTPTSGIPALRAAIANYANKYKQLEVNSDNIVVASGAKPMLFFPLLALINPGDEVIYPDPGFSVYKACINLVGGVAVPLTLMEENNFRVDLAELERKITPKTKLLIINSPQNPTGSIFTASDIQAIAELCLRHKIYVLSDEIYDRMIYTAEKCLSIATIPGMEEQTIILDGFSKTYAMTGWRIGYGIMPELLAKKVTQLTVISNSCTAEFTQHAALEALQGQQISVDSMIAEFKKRRDFFIAGLNSITGMHCNIPAGAFYAFPNISRFGKSSQEVAEHLLNDGLVAGLAGSNFGAAGEGFIRFSYATSIENLQLALERIEASLKKL
ncbi:MAG: pyridoxal phosphate-dependent aminotransferase [Clostridia bacterium]